MNPTRPERPRPHSAAGEQSRERLIQAGLRLFAERGFSKTSTREIAEAAQANVAAISYYFGDKASLYRAVFFEPLGKPEDDIARYNDPALTLTEALQGLFATFIEPWQHDEMVRDCMKLRFREMVEPTGLWEDEISECISLQHEALVTVLCRHLGLGRPDDEVRRLALSIAALGVHLYVGRDVTDAVAPRLNGQRDAAKLWADRLVMYAEAMIAAEAGRRARLQAVLKDKKK
jgi:AcrR family transcriptional regulator